MVPGLLCALNSYSFVITPAYAFYHVYVVLRWGVAGLDAAPP
jgi:hypothetical protein